MKSGSREDALRYAEKCANALQETVWSQEAGWTADAWDQIIHVVRYEAAYVSDCSVGAARAFESIVGIAVAYLRSEYLACANKRDISRIVSLRQNARDLRYYVNYASVGLWGGFNLLHFTDDERELIIEAGRRYRSLLSVLNKVIPDTP